jgi:2',3'-cyclic-nucleotide 2'-phosphodiesterase (5'-nucleotidase family)
MIDLMNSVGFDISAVGNHEYDYGESTLTDRMEQADFDWICANVDMGSTGIPEPLEYSTISIDGLKVTFLGLVETNGKENATIPSTHPWKVQNLTFQRPENVVAQYSDLKEQEDSDLYIALTHLGAEGYGGNLGDNQLASQFPFFDLIIGGHSHQKFTTTVNNIPIFQAGSYLNYLGKIELTVKDKIVNVIDFELINLNIYDEIDTEIKAVIDEYNDLPYLNEVIGYSHSFHDKQSVGCFYTDAMKGTMNTDVTFQNSGGIRSILDEGDITNREIFEISPFNNGTIIFDMSIAEIKAFLIGSGSGFYYSGIRISQMGSEIQIMDLNDNILPDNTLLTVGVNDYLPAVHEEYFPAGGDTQSLTCAETIISYLVNINSEVNYSNCDHYFSYQ